MVINVITKTYKPGTLGITGPQILGDILKRYGESVLEGIVIRHRADETFSFVEADDGDELLMVLHNAEYRRLYYGQNPCNYSNQFMRKTVYYEKVCHPRLGTNLLF